jgi:hypothetical protein
MPILHFLADAAQFHARSARRSSPGARGSRADHCREVGIKRYKRSTRKTVARTLKLTRSAETEIIQRCPTWDLLKYKTRLFLDPNQEAAFMMTAFWTE